MTDGGVPDAYVQAGWLTVISGAVNVLAAGTWLLASVLSIYGICCCVVPLGVMIGGLVETWVGYRMAQGEYIGHARARTAVRAVFGVVMCVGLLSLVFDVIVFVMLGRDEVAAWLAEQEALALSDGGPEPAH